MERKPISNRKADHYKVEQLLLDNLNPRLPKEVKDYSQLQLALYMENNFDLIPIAKSMSDNGYFDEEPLIIIPKDGEADRFIVIEGNRRLAALKMLTDPEFRSKSAHIDTYLELFESAVENLLLVPAVVYENREETCAMLGFRHIAGIMKWSSFSKAEFIYNFARDKRDKDFSEIARILGDQTGSIRRNYATYSIFLQAENLEIDTTRLKRDFSIFFTALGRVAFQNFIGVEISGCEIADLENPVPKDHLERLEEMIAWVHGSDVVKPVISESRELKQLGEVLKSEDALAYLRAGGNLQEAFSLSGGENAAIVRSINKARLNIEQSLKSIYRHTDDIEIHDSLFKCAQTMWQALRLFPDILPELNKKESEKE